ncbi:MAG: metalloprotease, partial [Acidimicrobiales bacterium]
MKGLELRLAGVPVRVEPMFFLGMGLLGWVMGRQGLLLVEWLVVAGGSILVHEMGHALAFRRFGSSASVVLHGFGGYTTGAGQPPTRSMVVSAAGPGVGLLIGVPVLLLARATDSPPPFVQALLADLVFVNLGWGLFNLLPILPLDGGNLVAAGFERLTNGGGERAARIVSIVASAVVAALAVWAGQQFVVLLIGYFGAQNLQALTTYREAPQRARIGQARDLMRGGDHRGAAEIAAKVRETA